jgi:protein phosphatase 1G
VTVTEKDAQKDEFLVIACDGIWNSMSSQQLCDFISERINSMHLKDIVAEAG